MAKEIVSGIYCFENLIDGKKYIGQSDNLARRIRRHLYELRNNISCSRYLQRAYNKYGEENLKFYIIEECPIKDLNEKEIYYIKELKSNHTEWGYNISWGGEAFMRGVEVTDEHRRKLSIASSGSSNGMYGKPTSEASKIATSKYNKIKVVSEATKDKYRKTMAGRKRLNAYPHPSSFYRGLNKDSCNCFIVRIPNPINKAREYIGYYRDEIKAAEAFDEKCWEYYHDINKLNFPENYITKE